MAETMQCVACAAVLPAGALFCGVCGRAVSSTTPPLDPFPWGLPPAHVPTSGRTPASPRSTASGGAHVEDVPVRAAPAGERFVLQFSTGESFTVTGTGLVGRNPHPEPGEYFDHVVTIADPGKSVSKTHLEFGQDDGAFWIADRYSGNGTRARDPEGQPKRCEPGRRYRVARGGRVEIGDQFFVVS